MGRVMSAVMEKLSKNKQTGGDVDPVDYFIKNYHGLMKTYGYISLKEYREMPQQLVNSLIRNINEDTKKEEAQIKKARKGRK